ncbi:hypothetical protein GYMLUDRAFT_59086 [Collybiopsis luxurians FD-317 M1]|uniref:Arylformamidase n=1 Tax=Collybiopsis luxurians FD-317 M1 TaxID=944289 RepID=A0A0D0CQ49_9AGAR|nr:hypothetical protein GYMLUDRAFT_59086 [Collybiopsis luxurians FD-317 M1]
MALTSTNKIDLTHLLDPDNISLYPDDPAFKCCPIATVSNDSYSVHSLSLGSHTGTHIDAPSHFIEGGITIDEVPLEQTTDRKAIAVDLTYKKGGEKITWEEDLADKLAALSVNLEGLVLLLYTGWSKYWGTPTYTESYPFLDRRAAEQLLFRGIKTIGMDTLSPDQIDGPEGYGVHNSILGAGGLLVENLNNLSALVEGETVAEVMVSFVPLSLKGCDGSPVRAFGWKVWKD